MIQPDHQRRFQKALGSQTPRESLGRLVVELREEGVSQIRVYFLFESFQKKTSGDDPRYDAIVDTMDEIHGGPWAKAGGFFPTTLTDEIIRTERKKA